MVTKHHKPPCLIQERLMATEVFVFPSRLSVFVLLKLPPACQWEQYADMKHHVLLYIAYFRSISVNVGLWCSNTAKISVRWKASTSTLNSSGYPLFVQSVTASVKDSDMFGLLTCRCVGWTPAHFTVPATEGFSAFTFVLSYIMKTCSSI